MYVTVVYIKPLLLIRCNDLRLVGGVNIPITISADL